MKKLLSLFMAIAMALTMGVTAFASTTTSSGSKIDKRIETLQAKQQKISDSKTANEAKQAKLVSKQDQFDAFKKALSEKRLAVLSNRKANITIVADTNQLRLSLAQSLNAIQKSGTTLPEETVTQLKGYSSQVKEIADSIKATKGQIKAITEQNKGFIKSEDYAAMDAAYAQIAVIQTWRHEQLVQINQLLNQMNALVATSSTGTASNTPSSLV